LKKARAVFHGSLHGEGDRDERASSGGQFVKIRSKKDLYAGLMFIAAAFVFVGVAKGWIAGTGYPMGTAVRMGPAYFPVVLGAILGALGLIIAARGFFLDDEAPRQTRWRILALILIGVAAFGILIGPLNAGAVVASIAVVFISASAGHEFKWLESIIEAVLLSIFTVLVFHHGLGLPFKIWPWS